MTPEAQNRAIAEAVGTHTVKRDVSIPGGYHVGVAITDQNGKRRWIWRDGNSVTSELGFIPPADFCADLNSAIQLCAVLAKQGWQCNINSGTDATWECEFAKVEGGLILEEHYAAADTLAPAICECFLNTLNLWTPTGT